MSTVAPPDNLQPIKKARVFGLIDGFNLYHALEEFEHGSTKAEKARYQKYKWLCLRTLMQQYIKGETEEIVSVHYCTSYPTWDESKRLRHQTYITALKNRGVTHTLGEFKLKTIRCRAVCRQPFNVHEEKQTDVNITTTMIEAVNTYDKLILLTADSDQVPAVRLVKKLHPEKELFVLPPIGRNSKELVHAGCRRLIMTEEILFNSLLPNPVNIIRAGKTVAQLWKPPSWPSP